MCQQPILHIANASDLDIRWRRGSWRHCAKSFVMNGVDEAQSSKALALVIRSSDIMTGTWHIIRSVLRLLLGSGCDKWELWHVDELSTSADNACVLPWPALVPVWQVGAVTCGGVVHFSRQCLHLTMTSSGPSLSCNVAIKLLMYQCVMWLPGFLAFMVRCSLWLGMIQPQTVVAQPVCPYYSHMLLCWQQPELLTGMQRMLTDSPHRTGDVNACHI